MWHQDIDRILRREEKELAGPFVYFAKNEILKQKKLAAPDRASHRYNEKLNDVGKTASGGDASGVSPNKILVARWVFGPPDRPDA